MYPIISLIGSRSRTMSWPPIRAVPSVGCRIPHNIRITVVFPEPLGPRNPKIDPFPTVNERGSTAVKAPKRLVNPSTSIIGSGIETSDQQRAAGGTRCPQRVARGPSHRLRDKPIHVLLDSCVTAFLIHCFEFFISPSENKRQPPFRRANDRRRSANEPSRRILV